ncbi:MAG: hypothetical protein IPH89_16030 [Bacteroidetes bacterium]|nr:hypothetical protein [Bacteroidota bacterium]
MIKGDSTRFDFKQDYLAIFKHSIDRFGKIISSEVSKQTAKKVKLKSPYPGTIPVAHVKDSIPYFYWRSEQSFSNSYRYSWHLYDSANIKRVNEVDFDFPLVSGKPFVRIFKSNGFFGIISEKYEILVRPEYEFIYELDGCFAILRDGLWQIYSPVNGFSSETFTAICTYSYKPGRVVFSGNKVGIINDKLEMILPLTDTSEAIKSMDFLELLGINGQYYGNQTYGYEGFVYNGEPVDFYRQLNNKILLERTWMRSTCNDLLLKYNIEPVDIITCMTFHFRHNFYLRETILNKRTISRLSFPVLLYCNYYVRNGSVNSLNYGDYWVNAIKNNQLSA